MSQRIFETREKSEGRYNWTVVNQGQGYRRHLSVAPGNYQKSTLIVTPFFIYLVSATRKKLLFIMSQRIFETRKKSEGRYNWTVVNQGHG